MERKFMWIKHVFKRLLKQKPNILQQETSTFCMKTVCHHKFRKVIFALFLYKVSVIKKRDISILKYGSLVARGILIEELYSIKIVSHMM